MIFHIDASEMQGPECTKVPAGILGGHCLSLGVGVVGLDDFDGVEVGDGFGGVVGHVDVDVGGAVAV